MLIKARVKSPRDLGKIVLEKLREMDGIASEAGKLLKVDSRHLDKKRIDSITVSYGFRGCE